MAYLMQSEKEKEESGQTGPVQLSGGTSVITSGGGGSPQGDGQSTKGTGFVNLDKYLNANASQTGAMADKVAGKVESKANEGLSSLNTVKDTFKAQAKGPGDTADLEAQVRSSPTKVDQGQFKGAYNQTYSGPKTLAEVKGYDDASGKIRAAESMAKGWDTAGGRSNLLQQSFGDQQYTGGMRGLDQALLQADEGAVAKGQQSTAQFGSLSKYIGDAESDASQFAASKQKEFTDSKARLDKALADGVAQTRAAIDARVQSENAKRGNRLDEYGGLGLGWNQDAMVNAARGFGIDPNQSLRINPFERGPDGQFKYIRGGGAVDASQMATDDELAALQALQSLGASGADFVTARSPLADDIGFNIDAYLADINKIPKPAPGRPVRNSYVDDGTRVTPLPTAKADTRTLPVITQTGPAKEVGRFVETIVQPLAGTAEGTRRNAEAVSRGLDKASKKYLEV